MGARKPVLEQLKNFKDNGISRESKRINEILDWQDEIGLKTNMQITELWDTLPNDFRNIFIWVCAATLSPEMTT